MIRKNCLFHALGNEISGKALSHIIYGRQYYAAVILSVFRTNFPSAVAIITLSKIFCLKICDTALRKTFIPAVKSWGIFPADFTFFRDKITPPHNFLFNLTKIFESCT